MKYGFNKNKFKKYLMRKFFFFNNKYVNQKEILYKINVNKCIFLA